MKIRWTGVKNGIECFNPVQDKPNLFHPQLAILKNNPSSVIIWMKQVTNILFPPIKTVLYKILRKKLVITQMMLS